MPSSICRPERSLNTQSVACRGAGRLPVTAAAICWTREPETRTTPMPPRPGALAIAAIVSRLTSSFGMSRLVAIEHALDLPLPKDRKNIVDQPVEHQPGGKEEEKDAEDERHELHYLGLYRIGRH